MSAHHRCPHCGLYHELSDADLALSIALGNSRHGPDSIQRVSWSQRRIGITAKEEHAMHKREEEARLKAIQEASDAALAQRLSDEEAMRQQQLVDDARFARVLQEGH